MLTGVCAGQLEENIVETILLENEDIEDKFGDSFKDQFKEVGKRRTCRNPKQESIMFEANNDIFKFLIRKEKISLAMGIVGVEEVIDVSQCFKCCKFGHIARTCQLDIKCHYCGLGHDGRECKSDIYDCINCKLSRLPPHERNHHARDRMCPIYIRRENLARRGVSYTT